MGSGISGLRLRGGEGLGGAPVEVMFGAGGVKVQVPAGQAEQRKTRGGVARGWSAEGWQASGTGHCVTASDTPEDGPFRWG